MEEALDGLDAAQGDGLLGLGVGGEQLGVSFRHGNAHHVDGKLHEAGEMLIHHVAGPGAPDGGKACTVGHAEEP